MCGENSVFLSRDDPCFEFGAMLHSARQANEIPESVVVIKARGRAIVHGPTASLASSGVLWGRK